MKTCISWNPIVAAIAVMFCCSFPATAPAQNLKCFILTPPEQLLEGVKKVAIMDFTVTASFHADDPPAKQKKSEVETLLDILTKKDAGKNQQKFTDSGVKLTDMMIARLLEDDRGIHDLGTGFLGLGGTKDGKSFQRGAHTDMQERTFQVSSEQMQAATVAKIQVNGSGSDRIAIKAASDPASQTLVKVPGEIELELVAAAGDWYKVKLLDGREGYLAKKDGKMLK